MNIRLFFLLLCLLVFKVTLAQELPSLVPTAPAAAELIKSIEYPVNYNTGLANINVPLHTITAGNISLPIKLSNNSRGFTQNEQEGVAGLGWSLSTDIEITRVVNGVDDFFNNNTTSNISNGVFGYYYYNDGYSYYLTGCDNPNITGEPKKHCVFTKAYRIDLRGDIDSEPDKFYYSLLSGRSGSFYFQKSEDVYNNTTVNTNTYSIDIVQFPYTGVKISIPVSPEGIEEEGSFLITDLDGTEYYYGGNNAIETNTSSGGQATLRGDHITSWKCTKIVTSNKQQEVNFTYDTQNQNVTFSGRDEVAMHYNKTFYTSNYFTPNIPTITDFEDFLTSADYNLTGNNVHDELMHVDGPFSENRIDNDDYFGTNEYLLNYPVHYTKRTDGYGVSAYVFPVNGDDVICKDEMLRFDVTKRIQNKLRLASITFPSGSATYSYDSSGQENGQLNTITLKDKNYNSIKTFTFNQSTEGDNIYAGSHYSKLYQYYDGSTSYLDSLNITATGETDLTYKFYYKVKQPYSNVDQALTGEKVYDHDININDFSINSEVGYFAIGPNYLSYQDHVNKYTSDPDYIVNNSGLSPWGMLESIIYPTKGTTYFEYEINKAYSSSSTTTTSLLGYRIKSITNHDNSNVTSKREFVYGSDENGGGIMRPFLYNKDSYFEYGMIELAQNNITTALKYEEVVGNGSSSTIKMLNNAVDTQIHITYGIDQDVGNFILLSDLNWQIAAGQYVSPQSIQNTYDDTYSFIKRKDERVKTFKKNGFETLADMKNPVYYNVVTEYTSSEEGAGEWRPTGKTVYTYRTNELFNSKSPFDNYQSDGLYPSGQISSFSYGQLAPYNWAYGQLISKVDYKALETSPVTTYTPVKEIINEYKTNNGVSNEEIYLGKRYFPMTTNVPISDNFDISKSFFEDVPSFQFKPETSLPIYTGYITLENTREIMHYDNGSVETRTDYTYDPTILLPSTVTTTISGDEPIITKTYYPQDITDIYALGADDLTTLEKSAIDRLKDDDLHRVATPIQTEIYKDANQDGNADSSELLNRQRTNYKVWDTNLVMPETVQTAIESNPLEDRIVYNDYYDNGNIKEVSKAYDSSIFYIWGYNDQYPIAKIENFTTTQALGIQSLITDAENASDADNNLTQEGLLRDALDDIRNDAALSNAMITTYTYDPLIGVTSVKDPRGYIMYYEYDNFNRLKQVKDANGNILSENEYNYKQ